MLKRSMLTTAALLATVALAQSQEAQPKRHHKAAPTAEKAAVPQDAPPLPETVQKWFGNTVDGILTGADKVLDGDEKK